jgi:putative DNA-invertase from lambdoid prophage Rac
MRGFTLEGVIVEEGVSGSVPLADRHAGGALVARLGKGDVLIAAKLDRVFRPALDALNTVAALKARGVKLHLIDIGGDVSGNGRESATSAKTEPPSNRTFDSTVTRVPSFAPFF